jgi:segregation and condensation protein A
MNDDINSVIDDFEDAERTAVMPGTDLVLDVGGFEGPIDVLLTLARDQKVDITQISILELADQYLEWVTKLRGSNIELAADYLVMAAWLAYLKSRLLIPDMSSEDEPTGEEMAEALQFQLRRLESMQDSGARLMARQQLGKDFFKRGDPEIFGYNSTSIYDVSMYELLSAYGEHTHRSNVKTLHIQGSDLFSPDEAVKRLMGLIGKIPDWASLDQFLPIELRGDIISRSAMASTFVAALQITKEGKMQMRQSGAFEPIFIRDADRKDGSDLAPNPKNDPKNDNETEIN